MPTYIILKCLITVSLMHTYNILNAYLRYPNAALSNHSVLTLHFSFLKKYGLEPGPIRIGLSKRLFLTKIYVTIMLETIKTAQNQQQ